MKKLLVIAVLGLFWSNLALAKCIQGDCKNGKGTWQYKKLPVKYIGEFRNGMAHGKAIVEFTGVAELKYVGEFKDSHPYGPGTLTYVESSDKKIYVGEVNDIFEPHGQGAMTLRNGRKYVGEFKGGLPEGDGTLTFPNGGKYVGGFKKGLYDGQGAVTNKNLKGGIVGEFKKGKLNGKAVETFPDGKKISGTFKNDILKGEAVTTWPDGTTTSAKYKNGEIFNGETRDESGNKYTVKNGRMIPQR